MVILKSVKTDSSGMKAGPKQTINLLRCHKKTVGNDSPWKFHIIYCPSALFYVLAHQRLTSGNYHHHLMRVILFPDPAQDLGKILKRHIRMQRRHTTITSAMTALHITSQRTLPEKLSQRMLFLLIENQLTLKFKGDFLLYGQSGHSI